MISNSRSVELRGCGVYIFSDDGRRLLLAQRGPAARHEQYKWEGPGGACDAGESYEDCARRELREELGVDITITGMIWEYQAVIDSNGDTWAAQVFRASIGQQVPCLQEPAKCTGFGWFTEAEIGKLYNAQLLADYSIKDLQKLGWLPD